MYDLGAKVSKNGRFSRHPQVPVNQDDFCLAYEISPMYRESLWLAQYGLDYIDAATRARFLLKVDKRLREF